MANIMKALSEGTANAGGFIVPEILSKEILAYVQANTVTIDDQQRVSMTSDELRLPSLTGGQTARWVNENATITGSDVAFGRTTLSAQKVAALTTVSSEVMEDANSSVAAIVAEQMGKDLALAIDNEILGTGSGNLSSDGLGATGSANNISCGTLGWESLVSASNMVLQDNHPMPDIMYINPVNVQKLQLLTDGNGRPIFNNEVFGSPMLRDGVIGTVLGMKVKPTTQLTTSTIICGVSGRMGYYGNRRQLRMNKDYQISTDNWILQSNMRVAWGLKYSDAHTVLREVA